MASLVYNPFKYRQLGDTSITPINLKTDTIKIALLTSTYTPSDEHDFYDDITNEVSGTGYTAGGATLTVTTSQDNTDNEGVFDAVDVSWTITGSFTARYAVIYKSTGSAATSPLICLIDFGTNKSVDNETFQIIFAAEGILNLT